MLCLVLVSRPFRIDVADNLSSNRQQCAIIVLYNMDDTIPITDESNYFDINMEMQLSF